MRTRPHKIRHGWTLLEMILALGLTTLLLSGIYGAMHLFYKGVTTTRASVERDQLARTVLRRVSDDLRSAVRYMPADTSGMSGAASGGLADAASALGAATGSGSSGSGSGSSGSSGTGSSGTGSGSGSSGSGTGSSGSGGSSSGSSGSSSSSSSSGSSSSSSSESSETTDNTTAQQIPGVYGTLNTLQIDICRLPRPDEIVANANNGTPTSEVRTVTYGMGTGFDSSGMPALIRTEQSRAAALYNNTTGSGTTDSNVAQVLAAEVANVEFRYFDGTQWLESWDSTAMGSVPLAIDVRVIMRSPEQMDVMDTSLDGATAADTAMNSPDSVFCLVVHLPAALAPSGTSSSTTTTEDPAAAAASSATTPSSPTSGSGSSNTGSSNSGSSNSGGSSGGGTKGGGGGGGGTKGGGGGGGTGGGGTGGTGGGGTGGTGGTGGGGTTPTPPPTPPADPTMMP